MTLLVSGRDDDACETSSSEPVWFNHDDGEHDDGIPTAPPLSPRLKTTYCALLPQLYTTTFPSGWHLRKNKPLSDHIFLDCGKVWEVRILDPSLQGWWIDVPP